jgi:adenosylcobinamide kinase/adenosylcobinamide-phosphate guanylyltransferase
MAALIYLTGPARSGKSRRAVELARPWGGGVVFVATYRANAADPEMTGRVRCHQAERPGWRTLEAPDDVAGALAALRPEPSGAVIDCLTLWLGDRLEQADEKILAAWAGQLERFRAAPWPVIVVGNEIGWSHVPELPVLRRFRDLAGTLAQQTATAADEAWLMVAGCPLRLK